MTCITSSIQRTFGFGAMLIAFMAMAFSGAMAEEVNPKISGAMAEIKAETAALGAPTLHGEDLMFGEHKVNGDYSVVDAVKEKFGGTATLFAKHDKNFVRVSTNVIKDGNRAVGTILDPSGPAYAAIIKGDAFYGMVDILGTFYDTAYEPVKDAEGNVIGIYYVGYSVE